MRYVAAYLLAGLGGNENPTSADIESILASVGVEADKEKLALVIKQLEGKNIDEVIEIGAGKLAKMGGGGTVVSSTVNIPAPSSPQQTNQVKEEKKEDTEESDDDLGFGLFD